MDNNQKEHLTQTHYIFPALVYLQDMIDSGALNMENFAALIDRNAQAHDHAGYQLPADWLETLPHLVNKFGWRIFEMPKMVEEQQAAAAQRKLEKKQEKAAKAAAQKAAPKVVQGTVQVPPDIPKKKIVVVRKKPQSPEKP
ncbi:MAG: hypothetical protein LBU17_02440 [Treponema sp.]|jgi:hypothetical protein|nr:hypothetical protein [Treponema sp.]